MKKIFLISAIILLCLTISYPTFASTSLPQDATSKICVIFFIDWNRNGFRDAEDDLEFGDVRISGQNFDDAYSTTPHALKCVDIIPGNYLITNEMKSDFYSFTTQSEMKIAVLPTSKVNVEFGLSPTLLCISFFIDENRNGKRDDFEKDLNRSVANYMFRTDIELYDSTYKVIKPLVLKMNFSKPSCYFVPAGEYHIENKILSYYPDYISTTQTTWDKAVTVDTTEKVEFGIAPKNEAATAVIQKPKTQICVSVYSDLNDNGIKDKGDGLVKDAFVEILDSSSKRITQFTTNGLSEPNCTAVEAGHYQIQVKEPEGYQATTKLYWELDILKGGEATLEFGVQKNSTVSNNTTLSPAFMRAILAAIGIFSFAFFNASPFLLMFILGQRIKLSDKTSSRLGKVFHVINISSGIVSAIITVGIWILTQNATERVAATIPMGILLAISLTGEILLRTRFRR